MSYSGTAGGTLAATIPYISLIRAAFIIRSASVVVLKEGLALTSISHGFRDESIKTSYP